ncbi:substrate-binding periplasmic protein [Maridesulfovibrio zosterae]|uniref:substrate-binding periplasmic protein n=1 Tax=Maridesulfovibrio zosterae TaxID=82171 RepID=UPI00041B1D3C|nr:transporter substrate-binding domain-containing protein [Maridesulfovibrio zosterae]
MTLHNKLKFILLFFILTVFISYTAYAEQIIVPVNHFPPWKIIDTNNNISGINIALTKRLLEKASVTPTFVSRPWKRCQLMMEKGTADIMNGLLKSSDREKYMIFLDPPYKTNSTKAFYTRKGESTKIRTYYDLANKTIGTVLGSKYFPKFDADKNLKKEIVTNTHTNIKKLTFGRIDTFIGTTTVTDYLIAHDGLEDKITKSEYIYSEPIPVYFAVSKKSPLANRIPELSAALKKMVESGEVDRIINEFTHKTN